MKNKLIFLIMFMLFPMNIFGLTYGGCSYSDVANLKSLVTNINLSYTYYNDTDPRFAVTINNITEDMYFIDSINGNTYYYSDTNNGEITISNYTGSSGVYKFYSNKSDCKGLSIGKKYYTFPIYNENYTSELCSNLKEFSLCKKWVKIRYNEDEFEEKINEYLSSLENDQKSENPVIKNTTENAIIKFYIDNYIYILLSIIIVSFVLSLLLKKNDKIKI